MRILFDSKEERYKSPFGTLTPGENCTLHIHIPTSVAALQAECVICYENGQEAFSVPMPFAYRDGLYAIYRGEFSFDWPGLLFYYFRVHKADSSFRLFKEGNGTNMEAGGCWQVSCIPESFTTPDWAKGAVIYQLFPDRFCTQIFQLHGRQCFPGRLGLQQQQIAAIDQQTADVGQHQIQGGMILLLADQGTNTHKRNGHSDSLDNIQ